jgi:hypothetical protein
MKRSVVTILMVLVMLLTLVMPSATPVSAANPNSKVTITPGSGQIPSYQPFVLTITEQNTGNEDLTNVYVTVWSILATTNINYVLGYPGYPPTSGDGTAIGVLEIGETWTWNIPGIVVNPGVTVISAYGHGLDQAGNSIQYPLYYEEYYAVDLTGTFIDDELGDAPDSTNHPSIAMMTGYLPNVQANFPTVYDPTLPGPSGPLHLSASGFAWLGTQVSYEEEADLGWDQDGLNNIDPTASANQDIFDDSITSIFLPPCQLTRFVYSATNASTVTTLNAYINVWFDWTHDGDWDDQPRCSVDPSTDALAPEWAVQNHVVTLAPGFNPGLLTPFFRSHNPPGQAVWMRITLTDGPINAANHGGPFFTPADLGKGGSGPTGGYQFGETEDYFILPSIGINPAPLPDGDVKAYYSHNIQVISGSPEYSWVIKKGTKLPPGLVLKTDKDDTSIATISGKPTRNGDYPFTVLVTDQSKAVAEQEFTIHINHAVTITVPRPIPPGDIGVEYNLEPATSGGTGEGTYHWTITRKDLPPGLHIDNSTGKISGVPTEPGTYGFTLTVTDDLTGLASKVMSIKINKDLEITTTSLKAATVGKSYQMTLKAAGGTKKYTWSLVPGESDDLPAWVDQDKFKDKGIIAPMKGMTPDVAGTYNLIFEVTDSLGDWAFSQPLTLMVQE